MHETVGHEPRLVRNAAVALLIACVSVSLFLALILQPMFGLRLPNWSNWGLLGFGMAAGLLAGLWGFVSVWRGWRQLQSRPRSFSSVPWRERPRFPGTLTVVLGALAGLLALSVVGIAGWAMIRIPAYEQEIISGATYADMSDAMILLTTYQELPEPYRSQEEARERREQEYEQIREAIRRGEQLSRYDQSRASLRPMNLSVMHRRGTRQLLSGEMVEGFIFTDLVPSEERIEQVIGGLTDRWDRPLRLDKIDSKTFDLRSAGQDGVFETIDDLVVSSDFDRDIVPTHWN